MKKKKNRTAFEFFVSSSSVVCNGGTCAAPETSVGATSFMLGSPSSLLIPKNQPEVSGDPLPPQLMELLRTAAQQGFLTSVLLTLLSEVGGDFLTANGYSKEQMFWINQTLRTLARMLIWGSTNSCLNLGVATAAPVVSHLLHNLGMSQQKANVLTAALALGTHLAANADNIPAVSLSIVTSTASGLLGSSIAQVGYRYIRNRFWGAAQEDALYEGRQEDTRTCGQSPFSAAN